MNKEDRIKEILKETDDNILSIGDKDIPVKYLRTMAAFVRYGSVMNAAEFLNVKQPIVTLHLNKVEEHLGGGIFGKSGRYKVLTKKGADVYNVIIEILRLNNELVRICSQKGDGTN